VHIANQPSPGLVTRGGLDFLAKIGRPRVWNGLR
jgi:hypothetical protein